MKTRKPTKKDIIRGCIGFFKDMILAILDFNIDRVHFDLIMIKETAKGNFEVVEEE